MKTPIKIITALGIIALVLLVWGLIGSYQAAKIGISCDIGVGSDGSVFCWEWHHNAIGNFGEAIDQILNK